MSETHMPAAPAAGEGAAAPPSTPEPYDDRSAGRAIEGLLGDDGDDDGYVPNSGDEPDGEPGESPAIAAEEGHSDPQATPAAIEPPKSWSAEDRAVFAKLPPEAQTIVSRRESQRDAEVTRRLSEIATDKQQWAADREAIASQRTQYLQSLQQLTLLAVPEAQAFQQVDWQKLAMENPAQYVQATAARDNLLARLSALKAETDRVQAAQQAEFQRQQQAFLDEQRARMIERVPELADKQQGPALVQDLRSFLGEYGFSAPEIDNVADHRLVAMGVELMRLKRAERARSSAQQQRQNVPPKVQQPGTTQGDDQTADGAMRGLIGRLGRTNSARDAGRLLERII